MSTSIINMINIKLGRTDMSMSFALSVLRLIKTLALSAVLAGCSSLETPCTFSLESEDQNDLLATLNLAPNSRVKIRYADCDTYEGQARGPHRHGYGTYSSVDGWRYVGNWNLGVREGEGKETSAKGDVFEGSWKDNRLSGNGAVSYADGGQYAGNLANYIREGFGIYTWPDGRRYEGNWKEGRRHGRGKQTFLSGDTYKGVWLDGVLTRRILTPEQQAAQKRREEENDRKLRNDKLKRAAKLAAERRREQEAQRLKEERLKLSRRQEEEERKERERQLAEEKYEAERDQRLKACDSFGFKGGTNEHAECAMKLYIAEQEKKDLTASRPSAQNNSVESKRQAERTRQQNERKQAELLRQQEAMAGAQRRQLAIQEAKLKEQKRIQELEASLRMMEFGVNLMTGNAGGGSAPSRKNHTQTYTINGQIITCNTVGSITNCF